MFVAGAYTVMAVAWVVVGMAAQATLSSIGTNTMVRGSYALRSSLKCM